MWKACTLAAFAIACHREAAAPQVPASAMQPPPAAAPVPDVDRGAYVAAISGCATCHDRTLGGGMEAKLPNGGTARLPNISPDRETGIGAWSDVQIVAAIRRGIRPDGSKLAPLMPYPYYNRMTDADAYAVVAFIRSQTPVRNQVKRSENLPAPVEMAEPRGNVDRVEDRHAHGEYLASLMHCAACHTPRQGQLANQALAGGTPFGKVIAANITPDRDTGIGSWSDDEIIRAVREMKDNSGQDLRPPMANYRDGYGKLTDDDAHALVVYMRSVPPVHHDITADKPPTIGKQ
jgi:mono/diheme cytochrome c family protein